MLLTLIPTIIERPNTKAIPNIFVNDEIVVASVLSVSPNHTELTCVVEQVIQVFTQAPIKFPEKTTQKPYSLRKKHPKNLREHAIKWQIFARFT